MGKKDPRVDAYIAKSAEFAKPILTHIRALVHEACPTAEETLKWNMPAFEYKGLLCLMAAFKGHAILSFWKHELVLGRRPERNAMGQFGRLGSVKDLPPNGILIKYLRKAAELNEAGKDSARLRSGAALKRELAIPGFLATALKKNQRARSHFERFSYSHQREYVEWLSSAKREETRQKRLHTAIEWITNGKPQNWKYARRLPA